MAITSTQTKAPASAFNRAQGSYIDTAGTPAAADLTVGFIPRYVAWHSTTGRISYEWFEGMAAGTTLKTVANGTRTLDTADVAISVSATTGVISIGAAAILQNEQIRWVATN